MNTNIACFDVFYYDDYANASCIVFDSITEEILSEYNMRIEKINEYIPGQFYKRELPCIMSLLSNIKEKIDLIITDSFVHLNEGKGLGIYVYEALNKEIPVIGVAKNFYTEAKDYIDIYRGESNKALYVSSIGVDLQKSANYIKNLKGKYRMPDMLKKVDTLSRL